MTSDTANDSLALRVVAQEPIPELKPSGCLVQAAKLIVLAIMIDAFVLLYKMPWAVATSTGFHQCWTTGSATGLPRLKSHGLIRRDL